MSESEIATLARAKGEAETREASAQAKELLETIRLFRVWNDQSFQLAGAVLLQVKARSEAIDAKKKELVGPFKDAIRNLEGFFNAPIKHYAEAERLLKSQILEWNAKINASREADASRGIPVLVAPPIEALEGTTIIRKRAFEVTDPDDVPRQFCSPDPAKIQAHLDAGGLEAIKGVRFFDKEIVRASKKGGVK